MLTREQVEALAAFDAHGSFVLSLYLDLDPVRQVRRSYQIAFKDLVKEARAHLPEPRRDDLEREVATVQAWLDTPFLRNALPASVRAQWADAGWRETRLADPATQKHRDALRVNLANLSTLRAAGVRIGFGTDAGALPHRVPGFAEHRELELMVDQAGFSAEQALVTAQVALGEITGASDARIVPLKDEIPLLGPDPDNVNDWLKIAADNNLNIRVAQANADAANQDVDAAWAGSRFVSPGAGLRIDVFGQKFRLDAAVPLDRGGVVFSAGWLESW